MKKLLLILFLFPHVFCYSQNDTVNFSATIKNEQFNILSYSSIGIKNNSKNNTVADINGLFKIKCKGTDTLIIRHLGYKMVILSVATLIKNDTFNLSPIIILPDDYQELKEVVVTAKKGKIRYRNYGSKSCDKPFALGVTSDNLGYEFGVKINITEKKDVKLEKFNCCITSSQLDSIKFRVNIYNFDSKDSSINLINKNILLISSAKRGELTIDLSKENIYLNDDILITLEVVEFFGKGSVFFSTSTVKGGSYFRKGKEAMWEKFPVIGLAFNIDIKLF